MNGSVWELIIQELHNVYVFLTGCYLDVPLGADISLWEVLVSLFIVGTIINLITGIPVDDDDD